MTGPEMAEFGALLPRLFPNEPDISDVLLKLDKGRLNLHVPANVSLQDQMTMLLGVANSQGWLPDLIAAIAGARAQVPELRDFLARHPFLDPTRNPALLDPWQTNQLFGGKFFIGRDALRKYGRKMNDPTERKVLVIQSSSRFIGKTYTAELIHFVARQQPLTKRTYIDLDNEVFDPGKLAARIAADWGMPPESLPRQDQEQAARWSQQLNRALIEESPNPQGFARWIVLDGFRERLPSPDLQEFIAQLAESIQNHDAFRLVLLNYNQSLPLKIKPFTFVETVMHITDTEIEQAFRAIYLRLKNAPIAPEHAQEYMAGVQQRLLQYKAENPELADNQLLVHCAISDMVESIA